MLESKERRMHEVTKELTNMMNNDFKVTQRSGDDRPHVTDVKLGEEE